MKRRSAKPNKLVPVIVIAVLVIGAIAFSGGAVLSESSGSGSSGSGKETRDELTGERTQVQVDEGKTRLEQEIFEGGVRKRVEMRNENGRILIRVKTKDAFGNETDQRLELRPEEGIARLKVEENGVEQSIRVRAQADRFIIEQSGLGQSATTKLPITVDTETNSIFVTTSLGIVKVQQLPAQAIEHVLAANILDRVTSTELDQSQTQQVVFRIKGVKNTSFLGIIKVDAPILTEVSAITGQTTLVQQPWFLNAFGFLFTK